MYKKFVSLTSNQSPSKNPYEIRTYMDENFRTPQPEWSTGNCIYQRDCDVPQNSTLAKVLTLQDEIRKIHQRTQDNIFLRPFCKKCKYEDRFTTCVVPQRTPDQLKQHAIMCENCLKIKHEMNERARNVDYLYTDHKSLIRLKDPDVQEEDEEFDESEGDEGILPELASPECSREYIYVPPTNLLEIKRPKSGIFINETERPQFSPSDGIPYSTYNPRVLQEQFDAQCLNKIDLIPGKNAEDLWTWNVGLQKNESELDRIFIEAAVPKFECTNQELYAYRIPKDLEKTFSARITLGTKAVQPQPLPRKKPHYQRPLEMACLYIAFVEGFRLNADFWTAETMDNIIKMSEKLIEKCVKINYKSPDNDYDIIPQVVERQAALNIKTHFAGPLQSEPNIYKALSIYFSKYNTCILCSNKLYLLIWKRCKNFFYVYDPNGRSENCTRDFKNGKSALLSTHFIEHLVHFIVNISQTNLGDDFKLYEIFLISYGKIIDPLPNKPFPKTSHKQWAVVNESYAVIPGCNNGLSQPTTAALDNPSMLISVMAILYNHIERANSWKPDQVDELIRLGTAYYKSLRRKLKLKDAQHVTISDLPDKYVLGTFKASLKKYPFMYTGTVTDFCKKFVDSLLTSSIQELFDNNWEAALLQIDNSVLGIWRDSELFYVYDPFRRGKAGQVLDPEDYRTQGAAILQIHTSIESFLRIAYEKALKMRRGGKFFIHAISVGCIKPIMDGKPRKLRYPKLKLTPETYEQLIEKLPEQGQGDIPDEGVQSKNEKNKKNKKDKKSKDKKNKIEKVCSIESLNEKERVIFVANSEIVETMLQGIICDIIDKFPETILGRPKLYKSAGRVLLRSDKEYLENLKHLVKRDQDCDNIEMSFKTEQDPNTPLISLEEELQLPSNFQSLPDGTWIIFGCQLLHRTDDEQFKLKGLLSSIVCAALSAKYKISTWSTKLIDYAIESVDDFGEEFQSYQYVLGALLHRKIPKLLLGDRTYEVNVQKILRSDVYKSLRQVLIETLIDFNRLLVVCQRYCCLIVKRYNFLYMFSGFPVNAVGYRKLTTGPGCMMRFVELDSLIRRIEFGCNPQGCDITNYVVIPVKVWDITPEPTGRYRTWPIKIEEQMYNKALEEKSRIEESKKLKMRFLNEELNKENRRIKDFQAERDRGIRNKNISSKIKNSEGTAIGEWRSDVDSEEEEFLDEDEAEEECIVEIKHDFGTELDTARDEEYQKLRPILYGYRLREKDLLYKIQGSKALEDRTNCIYHEIKPCLFSSALAILYAILKPLHEWTSHRIDQVIDSTLILSDTIDDMSNAQERIMKNISVDDYIFDIWLKVYEPLGLIGNLEKQLERALSQNKYLLFQTANCSYALSKDEYYHLFDSYPSMEIMDGGEDLAEEEEADDQKRKYSKSIKRYGERNTASWVLFADIKSLMKYMNQRACNMTWKEDREYKFMAMEIISFKKAPQSTFVLQLLTGMQSCNMQDEQETSICAHNESIAWLEHCLPIWSRLNRRNAAGRYRGMAVTKLKKYDIEIDQRLWSLWGNLHPQAPVFGVSTRGKQYLACCVMSLCAAYLYRLVDWSPQLLDSIIVNGDCYMQQSIQDIKCEDYQFALENLEAECLLDSVKFDVHIEMVAYGKLYSRPHYNRMNLAEALIYFFNHFQCGILQSFKKCLAIGYMPGRDGGYFMFDCQSHDHPLFPNGQGASYILRTKYLQILLYCIVVTLNIPYYNVQFTLHKVDLVIKDQEDDEGDE
ncbi:uncharacterized protein LOC119608478 [Lucilia sericata]|uniref:uncharacterized protein LOC119608478 n=1 Tax=Lucilia sericata TaxID=13632 RepID=UPI0018A85B34|nr:uncharacterized protein LOC119608478 [Lucilia sericata]